MQVAANWFVVEVEKRRKKKRIRKKKQTHQTLRHWVTKRRAKLKSDYAVQFGINIWNLKEVNCNWHTYLMSYIWNEEFAGWFIFFVHACRFIIKDHRFFRAHWMIHLQWVFDVFSCPYIHNAMSGLILLRLLSRFHKNTHTHIYKTIFRRIFHFRAFRWFCHAIDRRHIDDLTKKNSDILPVSRHSTKQSLALCIAMSQQYFVCVCFLHQIDIRFTHFQIQFSSDNMLMFCNFIYSLLLLFHMFVGWFGSLNFSVAKLRTLYFLL